MAIRFGLGYTTDEGKTITMMEEWDGLETRKVFDDGAIRTSRNCHLRFGVAEHSESE